MKKDINNNKVHISNLIFVFVFFLLALIIGKIGYLCLFYMKVNDSTLSAFIEKRNIKKEIIEPTRGTIYDVNGQNVCLSLPLNKNTRDANPENARNLIFFQDGHIRYEWEMEGGILL